MSVTTITGEQVRDDTIKRLDLNITVAGSSVIRKALEDLNAIISLSSSGVDAGTGDVTIKHKDTLGYLHIPTGGSVGDLLINSASGTAGWSSVLTVMSGFVPYTGATADVNLGLHSLTVDTNSLFVDSVNHRVGIGTTAPTSKFTVLNNALGTTTTSTVLLQNTTAALVGAQQVSPALVLEGQGWNIAGGGSSDTSKMFLHTQPLKRAAASEDVLTTPVPLLLITSQAGASTAVKNFQIGSDPYWIGYSNFWAGGVATPTDTNFSWQLKNDGSEQWFNANYLVFTVANVPKLITRASGVGIGDWAWNGTPSAKLHLSAGSDVANGAPFKLTSGTLTTGTNITAGSIEFLTDAFYGTITTGAVRKQFAFTSDLTDGYVPYTGAIYGLDLGANTLKVGNTLFVNSDGVGVGTLSPTSKLHIYTDAIGNDELLSLDADGNDNYTFVSDNSANSINLRTSTAGVIMAWNRDGSIGVGNSSPRVKLDILNGTANTDYYLPTTALITGANALFDSAIANLSIQSNSDMGIDVGASLNLGGRAITSSSVSYPFINISGRKENDISEDYAGYLQLGTSDARGAIIEQMRITSAGYIGVGKTSPSGIFDVASPYGTAGVSSQFILKPTFSYLGHTDGTGGFEGLSLFYDGAASIIKLGSSGITGNTLMLTISDDAGLFLFENGKVGMGGITTPTANLHLYAQTTVAGTAPLKFGTDSALLTTPEAGAFEADNLDLYYTIPNSSTPLRKTFAFKTDVEQLVYFKALTANSSVNTTSFTAITDFEYTVPLSSSITTYLIEVVLYSIMTIASLSNSALFQVVYGETATLLRTQYILNMDNKTNAYIDYIDSQYADTGPLFTTASNCKGSVHMKSILVVPANTTLRSVIVKQKFEVLPGNAGDYLIQSPGSYIKVTRIN